MDIETGGGIGATFFIGLFLIWLGLNIRIVKADTKDGL